MFIMYVDESGDPGKYNGMNSKHFILSGLIIDVQNWNEILNNIKEVRKFLKTNHNFLLRTEIHTSELIRINKNKEYRNIKKSDRIKILQIFAENVSQTMMNTKILNICINKTIIKKEHYQNLAWNRLIQRYENHLSKNNEFGIIVSDTTDEKSIRQELRKMRYFNYIPSKYSNESINNPIKRIIEDAFMRDSENSYFVQVADLISHLLYRYEYPKGSLKKYRIEKLFLLFEDLLLKEANSKDALGIVRK